MDNWDEAIEWERRWWGTCQNTFGEEEKQFHYADRMALTVKRDSRGSYIDLAGKSVLDIGGGPVSLLLKCRNGGRLVVIDPCPYPDWVRQRYEAVGIEFYQEKAEDLILEGFDEVWVYNVLQHVDEPARVVANARKSGKLVRAFDWLEISGVGHPHHLLEEDMNNWYGGKGQVEMGTGGKEYFGVFKQQPMVAICIPAYNAAHFLPDVLNSLEAQTYRNFHVYIGYHGSTDRTARFLATCAYGFPITLVDYKPMPGIGLNKHDAVERALRDEPDYITVVDADDKVLPRFVEANLQRIEKGDVDWVISWGRLFGDRQGYIHSAIEPLEKLKEHNNLHSWGMWKAEVMRRFNFNPESTWAEDWEHWIALTEHGYKGAIVEEELYLKRWHDKNLTITYGRQRHFRFHLIGLVHLPCSRTYLSCAFTQKNHKLARMLLSLGHDVFYYGAEGSDVSCTEFIQTHTLEEIRETWGDGSGSEIGYDWQNTDFRHDFNAKRTPLTLRFNEVVAKEMNLRKQYGDFLLLCMGQYQKPIADAVGLYLTCEPGIGYRGSIRGGFRAFESSYIQNFTYGSERPFESINGSYYDRVIPNYFDPEDVEYSEEKDNYFLYIGRMIKRKGILVAHLACEAIGAKLVLAGQGATVENGHLVGQDFRLPPGNWEFVGFADVEKRKSLMAYAKAVFVPTEYLECFGGVHVEAMLSGTPIITSNFGVFPATFSDGVEGYHCNTLDDFVWAAKHIDKLQPAVIRRNAERFLMQNVKWEYQRWFDDLWQLYLSTKGEKGWHHIRESEPEWRLKLDGQKETIKAQQAQEGTG